MKTYHNVGGGGREKKREGFPPIDSFYSKPSYIDSEIKLLKIANKYLCFPQNCSCGFFSPQNLPYSSSFRTYFSRNTLLKYLMRDELCPALLGDGFLFCRLVKLDLKAYC